MGKREAIRSEKGDLHMETERFDPEKADIPEKDREFIEKQGEISNEQNTGSLLFCQRNYRQAG